MWTDFPTSFIAYKGVAYLVPLVASVFTLGIEEEFEGRQASHAGNPRTAK